MYVEFLNILFYITLLLYVCSLVYLALGIFSVIKFNLQSALLSETKDFQPPVTVLKPICGLDPDMEKNLSSFCQQDYPEYQVIFGLHDQHDPAIPVIQKIIEESTNVDVSMIVDRRLYGTNHKVSNLINMQSAIKHDLIAIADSDVHVTQDYLTKIMRPFSDEETGAVTCLYSGSAYGKFFSRLNAMFINEWFLPSVLISKMLSPINFCLGASMVVRRNILKKMGGFKVLSNHLADDYMLGQRVVEQGYKIRLSDYLVENVVDEPSFRALFKHELRWARTLRIVEPLGFACTFFTDTLVISAFAAIALYLETQQIGFALLAVVITLFFRIILHWQIKRVVKHNQGDPFWLIPIRDLLTFSIRLISFTGNSVEWRNNEFNVDHASLMHNEKFKTELDNVDDIPELAATQDY